MINDITERIALLLLNRLFLTGPKTVHEFLVQGESPSRILEWMEQEDFLGKAEALKKVRAEFDPEKEIEKATALGVRILFFGDADYPELLKQIADPPLVLYMKGTFSESDRASVAIVGTRHPGFYGQAQARRFSAGLAEKGMTVVSGFARGVDHLAHEAALSISFGRTIAVLGCGLDIEYPKGTREMFEKITQRGAVISEYAFGTPPLAENFPRRNRIIAGLALGTLVIEAHSRSGSLITARLANEEGREVFALPGNVDQLGSRGTHQLIKEGAQLVESPEEIVEVLAPVLKSLPEVLPALQMVEPVFSQIPQKKSPGQQEALDPEEKRLLGLLGGEGLAYEEIMDYYPEESPRITSLLTALELKGTIRRQYDGRFQAAVKS